ncbi:hypothetical protein M2175_004584 [Bradyrhizobium elkanii]|uniref:hypothetical protein n=1 Tax=Bradyrhizobium TaxID=374 RepID=UPI002167A0A9|nr:MULTISPECIES: hypothetical protein [Bradyrhizobium]MCS3929553.1 hypothetical protein [Bradyrhizobium elkanii]MCS3970109.1 hypothetical protein [Bradyrhizobium japonicum]
MWSLLRVRRLPIELRVALIANAALLALNVSWAAAQGSWKVDPGTATLFGAVIGLAIIGQQARRGFANLIKSQRNQAELNRDARLHQVEIERAEKTAERERDRELLQASIRAEIAALMPGANGAGLGSYNLAVMNKALHDHGKQSTAKKIVLTSFEAQVFKANIDKIGLLGVSIAADVIKVLSRARPGISVELDAPIPHSVSAALYASDYDSMNKWHSDLHHVALRIIAQENGAKDPGTLIETQKSRYATLPSIDNLMPKL